MIRFGQNQV